MRHRPGEEHGRERSPARDPSRGEKRDVWMLVSDSTQEREQRHRPGVTARFGALRYQYVRAHRERQVDISEGLDLADQAAAGVLHAPSPIAGVRKRESDRSGACLERGLEVVACEPEERCDEADRERSVGALPNEVRLRAHPVGPLC